MKDQKEFFAELGKDPTNFEELKECPWCGTEGHALWGKQSYEDFSTVECVLCKVVYVRRRFNAIGRKRLADGYMAVRQNKKRAKMREKAHDLELDFIYRLVRSGRVIDVGCGGGYMLERMPREKWEVWGTELGNDAVARARKALNTDQIFEGEIENLDLPKDYFDLTVARGVIEHVPYPRSFLKKMAGLLKPSGYLFMSGPNLNSFCAQFYKEKWRLHYPTSHLFHFTVEHLTGALNEQGFNIVAEAYHYLETPYSSPEADILQLAREGHCCQAEWQREDDVGGVSSLLGQQVRGHMEERLISGEGPSE
ncbi:MAG: class I SAM-dependent methyltransferase [Desulfatiglandales bacterium]|nr:class I SAM-dependent methyltransferase [Desulfatiglandales bacterium]